MLKAAITLAATFVATFLVSTSAVAQYYNNNAANSYGVSNQYNGSNYINPYNNLYYNQGQTKFGPQGNLNNGINGNNQGFGNSFRIPPAAMPSPESIVREGLGKLKAFVLAGGAGDKARAREFAETQLAPYFDFPYMTKWSAGKYWKRIDTAKQEEMTSTLRDLFLASLARNLGGYNNPDVIVHRARQAAEDEVNVAVTVRYGHGASLRLTFRFYKSSVGWKVFDVTANGTSALVHYRKYFAQKMREAQAAKMAQQRAMQRQMQQQQQQQRMPYGYRGYGYPGYR